MELDLVNRVAMAHKVSDAGHGGRAQQPQLGVNIMQWGMEKCRQLDFEKSIQLPEICLALFWQNEFP